MAFINTQYSDVVEMALGTPLADGVRRMSPSSREFLADVGARFQVNGSSAAVDVSDDDPVVDYGGSHPNESHVATPITNLQSTAVGELVSDAVGYPLQADQTAALLFGHSFVDAGASRWAGGLVETTCPAVCAVTFRPTGNDVDIVLVDESGARLVPQSTSPLPAIRSYLEGVTPPRADLTDVDPAAVYATAGTQLQRVPLRSRSPQPIPYKLGDGLLTGAQCDRLSVTRARTLEVVGEVSTVQQALEDPPAQGGTRYYSATISRVTDISDSPWGGGATAPNGYVWGAPMGVGNCSRENRDACSGCCDSIMTGYAGAAVTAAATGVGAGLAVAGVGVVAGSIVGGIIGGITLIAGLVHSSLCRNDCHRLYNYNSNRRVDRQSLQLTAAVYDDDGKQIAYQVSVEPGAEPIVWGADTVIQMAWSGTQFSALSEAGDEIPVSVVRRPGDAGYYLRSWRDQTTLNNLAELPASPN